jgi:hypothetical protein
MPRPAETSGNGKRAMDFAVSVNEGGNPRDDVEPGRQRKQAVKRKRPYAIRGLPHASAFLKVISGLKEALIAPEEIIDPVIKVN